MASDCGLGLVGFSCSNRNSYDLDVVGVEESV